METISTYERFPGWIVFVSSFFSILVYLSGLIITSTLHWIAGTLYIILIVAFEYRLLSSHCTKCYYWGKLCGFGKGRVSSWFFRKEDSSLFCQKDMTWKDMIPDLFLALAPLIIGIALLITSFSIIVLASTLLLIILISAGNAYVRGKLTCRFCKQREIGCPAEKLFSKKQNS